MTFEPRWKTVEKDLQNNDAEIAGKAADEFQRIRNEELATSVHARSWEAGRRKEWQRNKPEWAKKKREEEKLNDPSYKMLEQIKDAGEIDMRVLPTAGYILVQPLDEKEQQTSSGIFIPVNQGEEPNKGKVIEVGDEQNAMGVVKQPAQSGDLVLFKRFAGIKITVEGVECRFMQFGDILARLVE